MDNGNRTQTIANGVTFLTVLIVVAVVHFARSVLIPLALAVLLAFLLGPLVARLRHWRLGRTPAALIVVTFSFLIMGALATLLTTQLADLAHRLPEYQQNVHKKLASIRDNGGGFVSRVTGAIHNLAEELTPPTPPASATTKDGEPRPVPVEIRKGPFSPFELLQSIVGSLLSVLVTAAIVVVFVIFILIQREDLRDRLIRLAGARRVNITTRVLDDAAHRVSRYLVAQLVINVGFGAVAGLGLALIGIPNPALWGILSAILRYIPYLGIWIAGAMPALVAFAVKPGWVDLPIIVGMYFCLDMLVYNFAEPMLYGNSTGISPMAILVAAVFWTWLWGPVGLLLSTPLTVLVVVLGRHIPNLGFLSVLLSDEEALAPETRLYQRLLAMDLEEATEVAEEYLQGKSLADLYDRVVVPALTLAEEDRHLRKLGAAQQRSIFEQTRLLIDDMGARADEVIHRLANGKARNGKTRAPTQDARIPPKELAGQPLVVCLPARDEADELAALMLVQLLARQRIPAKALPSSVLAGECIEQIAAEQPRVACVCSVPPFGYMHVRYLGRRLRTQHPDLKIVGVILTESKLEELRTRQPPIPADELACTLQQAVTQATALMHIEPAAKQAA